MNDKVSKLIDTVLEWWQEHEYDCHFDGEDERNVYDNDPEFVTLAKQLKNEL